MKIINLDTQVSTYKHVKEFVNQWHDAHSSIFQKTSGSTGSPKLIEIPKWKMEASARMTGDFFKLEECKTALLCMNPEYIGGKMMIVRSLVYDLDLFVTEVSSNPLKDLIISIDFVAMVPLQVEETIRNNPDKLNRIKYLIIGGAPVSDYLMKQVKRFSCEAYATFGMTETISHIALKNLKLENEPYRGIGNTRFYTEDDSLVIDCENLGIKGLKTNDSIELLDSQSFFWKGRTDFVINSGGVKIHPEEVEHKIKKELGLTHFIISKLPDEKLGNKVVFIGEKSEERPDLQQKIEAVVSKYESPKAYYFLPSLVLTASGKIDRNASTLAIQ